MNRTYLIFNRHAIRIQFNDSAALSLLEFLFGDQLAHSHTDLPVVDQISLIFQRGEWQLRDADQEALKIEKNVNDLASALSNHAIHSFAAANTDRVMLHAGLISDRFGSILLPGKPSSGKSNASLWLSHLGLSYHTDELVVINPVDSSLSAFTRPFTLRPRAMKYIQERIPLPPLNGNNHAQNRIILAKHTSFISHRLINSNYSHTIPPLKSIVFPVYTQSSRNQLTEISRARVCQELLRDQFSSSQTLEDRGLNAITTMTREIPCYLMLYNHFDQIETLLGDLIQRPR